MDEMPIKFYRDKQSSVLRKGCVMRIKAQRAVIPASTTNIGNSILIMKNSDSGGCGTLETPNIFLFPSVLSLILFLFGVI